MLSTSRMLIAVLLAVLAIPALAGAQGSTVISCDFDGGCTEAWGGFEGGRLEPSAAQAHSGQYSAAVTTGTTAGSAGGARGGGQCSPTDNRVPIQPGATYGWVGWVYIPAGAEVQDAFIRLATYAACSGGRQLETADSTVVTTTGAWVQVQGSTTVMGGANFAELRLVARPRTATAATVYFDDVMLVQGGGQPAMPTATGLATTPTSGATPVSTIAAPGTQPAATSTAAPLLTPTTMPIVLPVATNTPTGGVMPGMPRTGEPSPGLYLALALGALLIVLGAAVARRRTIRL